MKAVPTIIEDPVAPEVALAPGATQAELAYANMRRDILWGVLTPGAPLPLDALRVRYGIGPTPLREALIRLAGCGLVETEERRGFRVPAATMDDLRDITAQRQLIEREAVRQATLNATDQWESEVLAAYHRMRRVEEAAEISGAIQWEQWEERHRDFHAVLIAGAGSRRLTQFHRILYDQGDRYRRLTRPYVTVINEARDDHRIILDLILRRAANDAAEAVARHIGRLIAFAEGSSYFSAPVKPDA